MSPNRCPVLIALSHRLRTEAKEGPAKFQAFLAGDEFHKRFNGIPPSHRRKAIQAVVAAEKLIPDRLPPPVKAKRAGDDKKCNWRDPAMLAKLAHVYGICGGDHEKAGRMLRITADAARLAKWRFLGAAARTTMPQAA